MNGAGRTGARHLRALFNYLSDIIYLDGVFSAGAGLAVTDREAAEASVWGKFGKDRARDPLSGHRCAIPCRAVEQLELALEDLLVAVAEAEDAPLDEADAAPSSAASEPVENKPRRRPPVSDTTHASAVSLIRAVTALIVMPEACLQHDGDLRIVGEDVSELLDMITAQLKVIEIARIKKSCRRCEKMVQVPAPSRPITGSIAGPNLLAHVLVSKFDDHLPLDRQSEIFDRMGADIPDSTLVDWCGRSMQVLLPIIERIEAHIMASDLLHTPSRQIASQSPAG